MEQQPNLTLVSTPKDDEEVEYIKKVLKEDFNLFETKEEGKKREEILVSLKKCVKDAVKQIYKNKLISCANIDKKNFKNEKIGNNYIELLIQFEIDKYYNLRVYVLEPKTLKRRFECLINIDIIRG